MSTTHSTTPMCTLSTLDRTEVYAPQRLKPETEAASWRAFCSNRMYFSSIREVLCPVCCLILNSGTPLSNAVVAKPARCEWAPLRSRPRTPARPNALLRIHATEAGFKAAFCPFSPRLTLRKRGPLSMPAWRNLWSSARTGQVHSASGVFSGWLPREISTSLPCPCWSVFDLGSVMVTLRAWG
jgi:hypothetical protein